MVNRDVVSAKLVELANRIGRVRAHAKPTSAELAADADALDLVAFNLMLAVQTCADIASHIIADGGWPGARTLAESFVRLYEHGVLSRATADALSRAAATAGSHDIDAFAREVSTWLSRQS